MRLAEEIVEVYEYLWIPQRFEGDLERAKNWRKDSRFSSDPLKFVIKLGGELIKVFGLQTPKSKHATAALFKLPDGSLIACTYERDYVQACEIDEEL